MRSFIVKNISALLLLTFGLMVWGSGMVKGQTKTYATGTITGGLIASGILGAGTPIGLSRAATPSGLSIVGSLTGGLLGAPTSNTTNYYYSGSINTTNSSSTSTGSSSVLGENETIPVTVQANKNLQVLIIPAVGASAFIQFRYINPISAYTTTYLKLKSAPIRNSFLDVALLGTLGLASGNIITGEMFVDALQPQNSSSIKNQNTGTAISTASEPTITELIINKNKEWYVAVTPTVNTPYNSVRLTAQFPSDITVLSTSNNISFDVYNAFTSTAGCSKRALYTNEGTTTGVKLKTSTINDQLVLAEIVKNPEAAIDDDEASYSALSSGVADVTALGTVAQKFYFDHELDVKDGIRFHLALNNGLINLNVAQLNGIKFKAYSSKGVKVYEQGLGAIASLLGLNLLNLIQLGADHRDLDLTFVPGQKFDKIELEFNKGLVSVGVLTEALRIYDVSAVPAAPIITTQPNNINSTNICEGSPASFTVVSNTAIIPVTNYNWQYFDGTNWIPATGPSSNTSTYTISNSANNMNNRRFRVLLTGGSTNCPVIITSNEAVLTVNPKATAVDITASDQAICIGQQITLTASSSSVTSPVFNWYSDPGLTNSINSNLTISPTATTSYYVTVKGTGICENAPLTAKKVTVNVNPLPHSPNIVPLPKN